MWLGGVPAGCAMAVADRIVMLPAARDVGDDAALVARARGGERWAEEALYRRHGPRLLARVARLLGDPSEAEDVVQEVFARAFARLGELREPDAFGAWVLRAAVRRVWGISKWRAVRRRFGMSPGAVVYLAPVAGASPEERALLAEIEPVMAALPTADRIAWSLRMVDGLTLPEVAAACGCSLATAKRRIAAAKRRIAAAVGDRVGDAVDGGDE